jgi:hypothetical protein
MSEVTRRQALTQLASAFAVAGTFDRIAAIDLHAAVRQDGARAAAPTALPPAPYHTLERLTDLIIPVEEGRAGALDAGVPAWIDALLNVNADLKARYVSGLGWLDTAMHARHGTDFVSATPAQQTELLDVIAFQKNRTPETSAGVDFFILARRMTVDGFYTSEVGIREIIPEGRPPFSTFVVPQEAVDYVLSRSPFKTSET